MKTEETEETLRTLYDLRSYICERQRTLLRPLILAEDLRIVNQVRSLFLVTEYMPELYEQQCYMGSAMAYLHYYMDGYDAWIIELDKVTHKAFGKARIGYGEPEYGYISIKELVDNNVTVDLFWVPCPLGNIK